MHDPQRTLESLKSLRRERADRSPFASHTDFLRWSDQAAPLLEFNQELAESFKGSTRAATTVQTWRPEKYVPAINNAIGAVNKAITLLEHQSSLDSERKMQLNPPQNIPAPEKLTLKWLYENAPWSFYVWLLGVVSVSFALGFSASEIWTKINNANLSSAAPVTMNPTATSQPVKAASKP